MEWTPLEDEYDAYCRQLEEAEIEGQLQDPDTAQKHGYPTKLHLTEAEKDQLIEFIGHRTNEAFELFNKMGQVNPMAVGHALLQSAIVAMCWERERIGR